MRPATVVIDVLTTAGSRRPLRLQLQTTMKATPLFLLSVTLTPNRSQYFEYEKMSVGCGKWTAWRYTTDGLKLSQCALGWGDQVSSNCDMKAVKLSDRGVYWCESKHGDSSHTINITITGGKVILESPFLPVTEGQDVPLHCKTKTSSNLPADFYKDGHLIGTGPNGSLIIGNFSKTDEGAYKCKVRDGESPLSWLLMKDDPAPASLTASPDSSQLFEYKKLSLNCGDNSSSRGWKIFRATNFNAKSVGKMSSCGEDWGVPTFFGCELYAAKQDDSAVYWCESPGRQRSNSLNIGFLDKPVILQSPVLPVMEGQNVTLYCRTKQSSNLSADFYKDGSPIRTEPGGRMTIRHVNTTDEGLYKCHISGVGESSPSWLFVRATYSNTTKPSSWEGYQGYPSQLVLSVIRHLVVACPYCIATILMLSTCGHRPKGHSAGRKTLVSMEMCPLSEDDGARVIADVTTEHHF
ncbi:sialoadhesin-like isoform X2 [Perca flavescens]|uniref:sialoadhesin-like isoform X2 n=1 Tax=Perca flavescens TaxID=8167 RepID=UPI00106DD6E6|nr:sialoadhesin-like isoform X2 [Perca flavescens]